MLALVEVFFTPLHSVVTLVTLSLLSLPLASLLSSRSRSRSRALSLSLLSHTRVSHSRVFFLSSFSHARLPVFATLTRVHSLSLSISRTRVLSPSLASPALSRESSLLSFSLSLARLHTPSRCSCGRRPDAKDTS